MRANGQTNEMFKNNNKKTRDLTAIHESVDSTHSLNEQNSKEPTVLTVDNKAMDGKPLLGQPGGLDDPLRKGLSGAGTKWYLRYLSQGMQPQEARRKAEEHRTVGVKQSLNHEQRKRIADPNVSQELELKKHKSTIFNQALSDKDNSILCKNNKTIRVAVLAGQYPQIVLNSEELSLLEEAIVDEIAKGWISKLIFDGIQYKPGILLIDCSDNDTANWVQQIVPRLESWKGAKLQSLVGEKIPKTFLISMQLPKSAGQTPSKALALIYVQNTNVYTQLWEILSCCDEDNTQRMTIAIDYVSFQTICVNNNQLNYRFGKISVQLQVEKTNDDDTNINKAILSSNNSNKESA